VIYQRVIAYFRPYATQIALALVLLLLTVGLNLLKPWPIKWILDTVIAPGSVIPWQLAPMEAVLLASLILVSIYLMNGLFNVANSYLLINIGLKALLRLRTEMYAVLQHLPLHFHDRRRSGDSTFRVAYDSQAVQTLFNRGFATILGAALTLVGTFVVMFTMDATLALCSLAVVPFLWAAIYFFAHRVRRESAVVQQEESDVLARATEGLTSIRIVHAFGREDYEISEFAKEAAQSQAAHLKLTTTNSLSSLIIGLITAIGTALILYVGVQHVLAGTLKIGDLWVFLSYLALLYQPLEQLSYTAWAMEGAAAGMQRVFEVLDTEDTVPEQKGASVMRRATGRVTLDNVTFGYEPGHLILRGLSLTIEAGQTVALVGGTGAGKTTILSLIPRFYDPTSGVVRLDGTDVRTVTKRSLRDNISVVLQDTLLLSGTVEENIAYGLFGASPAQIQAAAQAAQAHEFILKLPQGYQTSVGERGVRLSGGQKQRLGIARAFLKQAPLLLLDEPTSALDLETEAEIMGTLKTLMDRQTTVIVTHRLHTIHHVDQIYLLAEGRLAESGTGPDLLAHGGHYAKLWQAGNG
jgi:ATP-binding cassette, subfamily B, bacterial